MKLTRIAAMAYLLAAIGFAGEVGAQQGNTDVPLEFPPASYEGRQYVDSRGCVYIRAGIAGAVSWVPRMNRGRNHVCGQTPTLAGRATTTARAPAPAANRVEQITLDPAPQRVVRSAPPQPAATVATARRAAPAPTPAPRVIKPAPQVVRAAPVPVPAPAPAPQRVVRQAAPAATANSNCQGASALSQKYIGNSQGLPVRCGPQSSSHVTVIRRGEAPADGKNVYILRGYDDSNLKIGPNRPERYMVPDQVFATLGAAQEPVIPPGYERAWKDDRLNRFRAFQTAEGFFDTQMVWTNTVPRRLVATAREHSIKPAIVLVPARR